MQFTLAGMLKPDIRSLQANDSRMWEMAFHWLWPIACSAANRRLAGFSPLAVEEVALDAIEDASKLVFDGEVGSFDQLRALVAVIANRRALDHIRRMQAERRSASATETIEGHPELATATPSPLEQANANDVAKILLTLMTKLRGRDRELLKAYLVGGLKQKDLSERFDLPMGTVGVNLSRALKLLRGELQLYPQLMKELLEALR